MKNLVRFNNYDFEYKIREIFRDVYISLMKLSINFLIINLNK